METSIMENQMEKKMENEMETGIIMKSCFFLFVGHGRQPVKARAPN